MNSYELKDSREKGRLTTSVLAAADVIVDVGVHHPGVADVALVIIPTPVATEMDPLPTNPAGPDRSPTSIRHVLIPRCQPSWPVTRPTLFPLDVASQHFVYFSRVAALVAETFTRRVTSGLVKKKKDEQIIRE